MASIQSKPAKTVSLILGSGGARGLAHIGVIKWLQENGFQIKFISSSSMGALVGGAYAVGKLDEFTEWITGLTKTDMLSLTDISWDSSGLIKGDKLIAELKNIIGDPKIEDLPISFNAVATDIENEKEVWLQKGPLLKAIRASIALPMIFTPLHWQGRTLIDGGVLNPIPIAPTFSQTNDLTIAVNLGAKPTKFEQDQATPQTIEESQNWLDDIGDFFSELLPEIDVTDKPKKTPFPWNMYDISNKAFDSMQSSIARQKLAAYPPDIVIEICRDACGMLEFYRAQEMINIGYETAAEIMQKHGHS